MKENTEGEYIADMAKPPATMFVIPVPSTAQTEYALSAEIFITAAHAPHANSVTIRYGSRSLYASCNGIR